MQILSRTRVDDDSHTESETSETPGTLYPLAVVAAELDCGVKELRKRLNGNVIRDENLMRCVPGTVVRQLIEQRDAELAASREAERQKRENPTPNPTIARVRAIKAAQRANPIDMSNCSSMPEKVAAMITSAPASVLQSVFDEAMTEADERTSDFLSGEMQIRKIGPTPSSRRR